MVEAAVRVWQGRWLINLTCQQGVHPRIGAADVIPFVPISGIKLEQCALLARQSRTGNLATLRRAGLLYGAAAARPNRANVEEVRRGQFEGCAKPSPRILPAGPTSAAPTSIPPQALCAVGARKLLVAYNIYFDSADVAMVRAIAKGVRAASALKGVKSHGSPGSRSRAACMDITDLEVTPLSQVYRAVLGLGRAPQSRARRGRSHRIAPRNCL